MQYQGINPSSLNDDELASWRDAYQIMLSRTAQLVQRKGGLLVSVHIGGSGIVADSIRHQQRPENWRVDECPKTEAPHPWVVLSGRDRIWHRADFPVN